MNIVMYGVNEANTARLAAQYGFAVCRSFEEMSSKQNLLVVDPLDEPSGQEAFYGEMERHADSVQAVIATAQSDLHWLYYAARPDMFFTVNDPADDSEEQFYELQRIVESQLGLITAHEE